MPPINSPAPGGPSNYSAAGSTSPSAPQCPFGFGRRAAPSTEPQGVDAKSVPANALLPEAQKLYLAKDYAGARDLLRRAKAEGVADATTLELLTMAERAADSGIADMKPAVALFEGRKYGQPITAELVTPDFVDRIPRETTAQRLLDLPRKAINKATGVVGGAIIEAASEYGFKKRGHLLPFELPGLLSALSENASRNRLNAQTEQNPTNGALANHAQPGEVRPDWTRHYQANQCHTDEPAEGAAGTPLYVQGHIPEDEIRTETPAMQDFPPAAEVAQAFLHPKGERTFAEAQSVLVTAWLQQFVHDLTVRGLEADPSKGKTITVPEDHPIAKTLGASSFWIRATERSEPGKVTFRDRGSHFWDASHIYGANAAEAEYIRRGGLATTPGDGKMYLREGKYLPVDEKTGLPITGLPENWTPLTAVFHELFVRNHNYICDQLLANEPQIKWTDDFLYYTAKRINAAQMAMIHTTEWTPAIITDPGIVVGMNTNAKGLLQTKFRAFEDRRTDAWFKPEHHVLGGFVGNERDNHGVPGVLSNGFPQTYRLHSLVPDALAIVPVSRVENLKPGEKVEPLTLWPIDGLRERAALKDVKGYGRAENDPEGISIADLFNSMMMQHTTGLVPNNYPRFMCNMPTGDSAAVDLAAIDIQRAREGDAPRYNQFRKANNLEPIKTFEELGMDPEYTEKLKRVYQGEVELIDVPVGMLSEAKRSPGFVLTPTQFQLFKREASGRFHKDPLLSSRGNDASITKTGRDLINQARITDLLMLHYPELAKTGARWLNNGFEPSGTSYLTHPNEHPLSAPDNERYRVRREYNAPGAEAPAPKKFLGFLPFGREHKAPGAEVTQS